MLATTIRLATALALAAALTLGLAAPANADPARYDEIAAEYWGASPDCQRVEVIADQAAITAAGHPAGTAAMAELDGCRITTGDGYANTTDASRCAIYVHEWGHLLGHGHEPAGDPQNVMPPVIGLDGVAYTTTAAICIDRLGPPPSEDFGPTDQALAQEAAAGARESKRQAKASRRVFERRLARTLARRKACTRAARARARR